MRITRTARPMSDHDTPAPVSAEDQLREMLAVWRDNRRRLGEDSRIPEPLPDDVGAAVSAWMSWYQPPRQPDESPQKTTTGICDPYAARLKSTLAIFLGLSRRDRRFIRACIEDGVQWRGERIDMLAEIYEATMRARQGSPGDARTEAIMTARKRLGLAIPLEA